MSKEDEEKIVCIGQASGLMVAQVALQMSHLSIGQARRLNRHAMQVFGDDYSDEYRHDGKLIIGTSINRHAANDTRRKILGLQEVVEKATGTVVPIDASTIRS